MGTEQEHDGQDAAETGQGVPQTIYETTEMTPDQVDSQNATYAAMGLPVRVIHVGLFSAKMERQPDGSYKRSAIRRRNNGSDTSDDSE